MGLCIKLMLLLTSFVFAQGTTVAKVNDDNSSVSVYEYLRGRDGRDGPPGPPGFPGYPGHHGEKGEIGQQGKDGLVGEKGAKGELGEKGMRGPLGPRGPFGSKGSRGEKGLSGPQGHRGLEGARGLPGPRGPAGQPAPSNGGVVYTRWGKSSCPNVHGTTQIYSGYMAGSLYSQKGGGTNYLCMPSDPEYTLAFRSGVQGNAPLYASEYHRTVNTQRQNYDVPCVVCSATTRNHVLFIPAKTSCPSTWTKEYDGFIMTALHYQHPKTFECVDKDQEPRPNSSIEIGGASVVHVEAVCRGLPCPPYVAEKELNCVICTK